MKHSWISPSKIAVSKHCSGSLKQQHDLLKLPPTDPQLDGHTCHNYAANLFGKPMEFDQDRLTDEMVGAATMYVNYVKSIAGDKAVIEERVNIPKIHPDCFGYPDAYYYDEPVRTLHVFDLKFGWRLVEAYFNWQLLCYASGIVPYAEKYVLHIIQPRPYHPEGPIRTHELDFITFKSECVRIAQAVERAINDPVLSTGPHCRNCDALLKCNARWEAITNGIEVVSKIDQDDMTPEQVTSQFLILDYVQDMINKQKDKAEQTALYLISQGKNLPGLTLEQGAESIKWCGDPKSIIATGDASGFDLRKKDAVMTPLQVKKAGAPEYLVNLLSKTYKGKRKLRPIDLNKANKIFGS